MRPANDKCNSRSICKKLWVHSPAITVGNVIKSIRQHLQSMIASNKNIHNYSWKHPVDRTPFAFMKTYRDNATTYSGMQQWPTSAITVGNIIRWISQHLQLMIPSNENFHNHSHPWEHPDDNATAYSGMQQWPTSLLLLAMSSRRTDNICSSW